MTPCRGSPPPPDPSTGTTLLTTDTPLDDEDLARLDTLLQSLPAPLEPLDVSALDGYLCGVLLQPRPVPVEAWLPRAADIEGVVDGLWQFQRPQQAGYQVFDP